MAGVQDDERPGGPRRAARPRIGDAVRRRHGRRCGGDAPEKQRGQPHHSPARDGQTAGGGECCRPAGRTMSHGARRSPLRRRVKIPSRSRGLASGVETLRQAEPSPAAAGPARPRRGAPGPALWNPTPSSIVNRPGSARCRWRTGAVPPMVQTPRPHGRGESAQARTRHGDADGGLAIRRSGALRPPPRVLRPRGTGRARTLAAAARSTDRGGPRSTACPTLPRPPHPARATCRDAWGR